jgi:hypothetical protein
MKKDRDNQLLRDFIHLDEPEEPGPEVKSAYQTGFILGGFLGAIAGFMLCLLLLFLLRWIQ